MDHIPLLSVVSELPFSVGKKTLIDVVCGSVTKKIVSSDAYMDCPSFGALEQEPAAKVEQVFDTLITHGYLAYVRSGQYRLVQLTAKGAQELRNPSFSLSSPAPRIVSTPLSGAHRTVIQEHSSFLGRYTFDQQSAITHPGSRVLCIAGAGTGKTSVLTARIRFLVSVLGVSAKDILAITFTRKACAEMRERLSGIPVTISTFNGFSERILRAAQKSQPIISYKDRILLFREAARLEEIHISSLLEDYYSRAQRAGVSSEELSRRLMKDVFSIIDHYANENKAVPDSGSSALATVLLRLAQRILSLLRLRGLRDYSLQLVDVLSLFRSSPNVIPRFSHILVDEYQDVNSVQQELLSLLNPSSLFVVGDPRQSIFGWRGSKVAYITQFESDGVIQLQDNFRSDAEIVSVANKTIAQSGFAPLRSGSSSSGTVQVLSYSSEQEELRAVAALVSSVQGSSVFVLARTNKQLSSLSEVLLSLGVKHKIRSEEDEDSVSGIVLSTVHAIKGLEADMVLLFGVTNKYFPCRVSDHPVVDLLKDSFLDREEEERRLLYVALTRAKRSLFVSYHGSLSYLLDGVFSSSAPVRDDSCYERLRDWRKQVASRKGLPAYCVCSDKTLRTLADTKPSSLHEISLVHGVGDAILTQYGSEILDILLQ